MKSSRNNFILTVSFCEGGKFGKTAFGKKLCASVLATVLILLLQMIMRLNSTLFVMF